MMPWAGPLGRAAAVIGVDSAQLWQPLIPVQAIGAMMLIGFSCALGLREQRRIAILPTRTEDPVDFPAALPREISSSPKDAFRFAANILIFSGLMVMLISGVLPAGYVFMIGLALALLLDYDSARTQMAAIAEHAPNAITMAAIILAAGSFLGVMDGGGVLKSIAADIAAILPDALAPNLHLVLGAFGVPMELILNTDAYYFGLLPVVSEVVTPHGVSPESVVYTLMIGKIVGTYISPFSPALWLALDLSGLEMGRHIRYALVPMWLFSLALMAIASAMGVIIIQ